MYTSLTTGSVLLSTTPPMLTLRLDLQPVESYIPELVEECPHRREPLDTRPIQPLRTCTPLDQEAGLSQHPQMLGHGWAGDVRKVGRDRPRGHLLHLDQTEDLPSLWFDDGDQQRLHGLQRRPMPT